MILDYNPTNSQFLFHGAASKEDKNRAIDCGMEYSLPASKAGRSVFFSPSPYSALPLWDFGTERARGQLNLLKKRYDASWAIEWKGSRLLMPDDVDLHPYQSAGVDYAMQEANALIGDQPGLGKTAQAIVVANEMKAKRVLVVCPAAVRLQWVREIKTWGLGDTRSYVIQKAAHGVSPLARWTITSYDLLRGALLPAFQRGGWDLVILDEAHYLKTPTAERTRAAFGGITVKEDDEGERRRVNQKGVAEGAQKIITLTGTPLPNRPNEAYTQARALDWGCVDFMSIDEFKARFNPGGTGWEVTHKLAELHARLRSSFMVRRMKREVLTQLPRTSYEIVYASPTGAIKEALAHETMLEIEITGAGVKAGFDGQISTVRKEMGVAKAPHVIEFVNNLLDGGLDKLVVFGWHREVLDLWQAAWTKAKYNPVRIDGSSSMTQREQAKKSFTEDPRCRVIFGNLQSMGTGVDGLQRVCSTVVFGEQSWVPGENEQGVDRLNRMGQEDAVRAIFLVAEGSIDERIAASAVEKAKTAHKTLDTRL